MVKISKSKTEEEFKNNIIIAYVGSNKWLLILFGYCYLRFICNLVLAFCYFRFRVRPHPALRPQAVACPPVKPEMRRHR